MGYRQFNNRKRTRGRNYKFVKVFAGSNTTEKKVVRFAILSDWSQRIKDAFSF